MKLKIIKISNRVFSFLVFMGIATSLSLYAQNPDEILRKARKSTTAEGLESISLLKIIDKKGREKVRKTTMASRRFDSGEEKRIIKFLEPADVRGTGILIFDYEDKNDDMWIYMPALRKTRRIVSTEKGKSFMGSEFTNADMSAPMLEDFDNKLLGEELVDEVMCYKIEMIPKNSELSSAYGWGRRIDFIGKLDFVRRKSLIYDQGNKLLKELLVKEIEPVVKGEGIYLPRWMSVENLQNNRKSILIMEKILYNPNVDPKLFTTNYLEKN